MAEKSETLITHAPVQLLVTGGCGFIGSNFIRYWLDRYPDDRIVNLDALTYAGNPENLTDVEHNPRYTFVHGNICDAQAVEQAIQNCSYVVHFAAESHVDRSITNPENFLLTNVLGTHVLLQAALKHSVRRFHHISTDEVFGTLDISNPHGFSETTPYAPRSPYSASKAASDHLVRAYAETFGLKHTITNCSNNYGPYMFPEKFIPLAITNLLENKKIPIYGDGQQIRDWLFVTDHCRAIEVVLLQAQDNSTYVVGGLTEDSTNLQIAQMLLALMNQSEDMIEYITDRPGHDRRYSVNWQKIRADLQWKPQVTLEQGLRSTIEWYTEHESWWKPLKEKQSEYFRAQYTVQY